MAGQVSPGVVIRERDLTNSRVDNLTNNVAAFSGPFEKGPVNQVVNIISERELLDYFGKPNDNNFEYWYTASNFLLYGGQLEITRTATANLKNAVSNSATAELIQNVSDYEANIEISNSKSYQWAAKTAGSWGNNILVATVDHGYDYALTLASAVSLNAGDKVWQLEGSDDTSAISSVVYEDTTSSTSAKVFESNGILLGTATASKGTYYSSATSTATTAAVSESATTVAVTSATGIAANDYVLLNGVEVVKVSAIASNNLTVVRGKFGTAAVAHASGVTAVKLSSVNCTGVVDWYDTVTIGSTGIRWSGIAARPKTSQFALDRGAKYDEMHIVVVDTTGKLTGTPNTVLERVLFASKASDAKSAEGDTSYYKTVVKQTSSYVYSAAKETVLVDPAGVTGVTIGSTVATNAGVGNTFGITEAKSYALAGGVDDYAPTVADITNAYNLFADIENIRLDFILNGPGLSTRTDSITKAQNIINIASTRKDCVAFVSPYRAAVIGSGATSVTTQRDNIISFFDGVGSSTSYAVFDSGYKYIYDRFNDTYRYIPCNSDVAGLCVETSEILDPWFSPAGFSRGNLKNAIKLAYVPNKGDRDKLYQKRINPITVFPGQGVVLFGDKTALATPSAFDRINVRLLFLTLEKRIENLAKSVLFELNDEITRNSFANAASSYLSEVRSRRGIDDFLVVCDETNNTPDVIDRNEFFAELYIKPARSINFITITFVATRTGISFDELVAR